MAERKGSLLGGLVNYTVVLGGRAGFSTISLQRGPLLGGAKQPRAKSPRGGDTAPGGRAPR